MDNSVSKMSEEEVRHFIDQLKDEGLLTEENKIIWEMIVPERLKRMYDVLNKRTRYITVLTEGVDDRHNQSAVLRSAEAFGLQDVHIVTGQTDFRPNKFVTRNADKWLTIHQKPDIRTAIEDLQASGYQVLASYLGEGTIPLQEIDLSKPTALLFGNEHSGISEEALRLADGKFMIPMQGFVQSFNISVAAALTLYDVTERAKRRIKGRYYLTIEEKKIIYEKWMLDTLNPRVRRMIETGVLS